jgi:hypothetical protein
MAQQANAIQGGIDQVRTAVRRADKQFRKVQRRVETRRKRIEKDLSSRRRSFERRVQREWARLQKEWRKRPLVRRAETLQKDVARQLEKGMSTVLEAFPLATKREIERLDRKLNTINRKLRDLEKVQA